MNSLGFLPQCSVRLLCDSEGTLNPFVGSVEELAVYFKGFQHLKKCFTDLVQVLEKGSVLHPPPRPLPAGRKAQDTCAPCLAIVLPCTFLLG